jgi:hypothetical protein
MGDPSAKHEQAKTQRQECVVAIINSPSRHKIVVAGPGTGKTHLFKEMLRNKPIVSREGVNLQILRDVSSRNNLVLKK